MRALPALSEPHHTRRDAYFGRAWFRSPRALPMLRRNIHPPRARPLCRYGHQQRDRDHRCAEGGAQRVGCDGDHRM